MFGDDQAAGAVPISPARAGAAGGRGEAGRVWNSGRRDPGRPSSPAAPSALFPHRSAWRPEPCLARDPRHHEGDGGPRPLPVLDEPKRTKDATLSAELQQALAMMEDLIKSCELAVDLAAVTGCPDDMGKLGKLLMHDPFNVWTVHKDRYKMKDFMRFKPSQRQIYLFERGIVFCKIRVDPTDQGLSPHYSFKKSMKLMALSIHQVGRGNNKKFEIASQDGLEKHILQAASKEVRDSWFSEISKLLMGQQQNIKGQESLQFEASTSKENELKCVPWTENMERPTSSSKEDSVLSICGIKGSTSREFISTETFEECEGAEEMGKESSVLSLSGLFQLDEAYETCTSKSLLEPGDGIPGEEWEEETSEDRGEESAAVSLGLHTPKDA
ncbi:PREDICTED: probable guanine nucleotide exchange factor MCF2L2-like [Elephantulus edwardii]|uniref:probable guanine nucleotide exchange factor MCF2L2-like n=1 Tax=Elephantulus edwardii TaxID=28737 RepID=UPI0003F0B2B2|nr:PREDICTED: probable guanine nucleotide exchange factor MCF2L2-like [Elephantulus edwardii]